MTQLETAMAILLKTFDQYAGSDGNGGSLSKTEVKTMLEKELPALIKAAKNPGEVDSLLQALDANGDAAVEFNEFIILVAALTCACHDRCKK